MLRLNSDRLVFHIYSQDFTYTCLIRFSNAAFKLLKKNIYKLVREKKKEKREAQIKHTTLKKKTNTHQTRE